MISTLRKSGGSLVMTIPKAFIEQNNLKDGASIEVQLNGRELILKAPKRPRYTLAQLMTEMPKELPMVEGWDEMTSLGSEVV